MARIVLVHGIDNQRETPDLSKRRGCRPWRGACVWRVGRISVTGSGHHARGQTVSSAERRIMEYLFRSPGHQGASDDLRDLSPEQTAHAGALALEWLERVAERAGADSADA